MLSSIKRYVAMFQSSTAKVDAADALVGYYAAQITGTRFVTEQHSAVLKVCVSITLFFFVLHQNIRFLT
jgi:hypothetical protein